MVGADGELIASDPTLDQFGLTVVSPPSDAGVIVGFSGIAGNRPLTYGNTVVLWDTPSPVYDGPNRTPPLTVVDVAQNAQPSSVHIGWQFQSSDYLVTYHTDATLTTMVAALTLKPRFALEVAPPVSVSISVFQLDSTSITVVYNTLQGYLPQTFGNWVGVWHGFPGPYFAPATKTWAAVGSDDTQGLVTIPNLQIIAGFQYRVIYFMGPHADGAPGSNVGAVLDFTAADAASTT